MGEPFYDNMARVMKLYPNQGMHSNGLFIADLAPRAIDYLEQAPVLACAFGVRRNTSADRLYVASRLGGPLERGERLRAVMAAVALPYPLRKLRGNAITPYAAAFLRDTAMLNPSTLSQAIPERIGKQREWLRSIRDWQGRMKMRGESGKLGFDWIALNGQHCQDREAGNIADFVYVHRSLDFHRWSYERMIAEVELWHDRLASDRALSRYGAGIKPDTIIDFSDWPDHAEVGDFEVFKLSTPAMLVEEGARMRHCVASYIPDVISGKTHIFSVRQAMRRMATVQVTGTRIVQIKAFANKAPTKVTQAAAILFVQLHKEQA